MGLELLSFKPPPPLARQFKKIKNAQNFILQHEFIRLINVCNPLWIL